LGWWVLALGDGKCNIGGGEVGFEYMPYVGAYGAHCRKRAIGGVGVYRF